MKKTYVPSKQLEKFKAVTTLQINVDRAVDVETAYEMLSYIIKLEQKLTELDVDLNTISGRLKWEFSSGYYRPLSR